MNTSPTGLASDFIKAQIRKNTELEEQIISLNETIELLKGESHNDYSLYRKILDLLVPYIKFEYNKDGGYNIKLDPPEIYMPLDAIDNIIKEIEKYKQKML